MTDFIHNKLPDVEGPGRGGWADEARACRDVIDARLKEISAGFSAHVPPLGRAMGDAVLAPGKRFRGVLMLMIARATGGVVPATVDAACAVELMHTASLVIDDLPAMDGATLRRGLPTVHVAHGEGRAILAGIALVSEAFRILASAPGATPEARARMVMVLAECIGPAGLCAGQDLDLHDAKTMQSIALEQDLKTGMLFSAGFRMVALLNGYAAEEVAMLAALSGHLGRVFQSFDDLRDLAAGPGEAGKTQGLDRAQAGPDKGLLAVADLKLAANHYNELRNALDDDLAGLWFDSQPLRDYVASILPADPAIRVNAAE